MKECLFPPLAGTQEGERVVSAAPRSHTPHPRGCRLAESCVLHKSTGGKSPAAPLHTPHASTVHTQPEEECAGLSTPPRSSPGTQHARLATMVQTVHHKVTKVERLAVTCQRRGPRTCPPQEAESCVGGPGHDCHPPSLTHSQMCSSPQDYLLDCIFFL